MIEKLIPYGPYVIVERAKIKDISDSGIILPESLENRPHLSKIICVNDGWFTKEGAFIKYDFKPGQLVYITLPGHGGEKFKHEGRLYWKLNIEWVSLVVEGPDVDKIVFISEND